MPEEPESVEFSVEMFPDALATTGDTRHWIALCPGCQATTGMMSGTAPPKWIGLSVAEWLAEGRIVERATTSTVWVTNCTCGRSGEAVPRA